MPEVNSNLEQGGIPSIPQDSQFLNNKLPSANNSKFYQSKVFIIALLFFLGAVAFGATYYFMNQVAPKQVATTLPSVPQSSKAPLTLMLASPMDGMLVSDSNLIVKGKTLPNVPVVFYTETDQGSVESDRTGNFEGSLILSDGINSLTVVAYGSDGEEKSATVDVVYEPSKVSMSL